MNLDEQKTKPVRTAKKGEGWRELQESKAARTAPHLFSTKRERANEPALLLS